MNDIAEVSNDTFNYKNYEQLLSQQEDHDQTRVENDIMDTLRTRRLGGTKCLNPKHEISRSNSPPRLFPHSTHAENKNSWYIQSKHLNDDVIRSSTRGAELNAIADNQRLSNTLLHGDKLTEECNRRVEGLTPRVRKAEEWFPITLGEAYALQGVDKNVLLDAYAATKAPTNLNPPDLEPWLPTQIATSKTAKSASAPSSVDKMHLRVAEAPNIRMK